MSIGLEALRAVENDPPAKQLLGCRKIICSIEKGEMETTVRLYKMLRKTLRSIKDSKVGSDGKLDAISLLERLRKHNPEAEEQETLSETSTTNQSSTDPDRRPIDAFDCMKVLGPGAHRLVSNRFERDELLAELLGDLNVGAVQSLILDMRRPDPNGGCRLLHFAVIFRAAQQYLADHGASELPREAADLEYEKDDKSFIERMRERGVEGINYGYTNLRSTE